MIIVVGTRPHCDDGVVNSSSTALRFVDDDALFATSRPSRLLFTTPSVEK